MKNKLFLLVAILTFAVACKKSMISKNDTFVTGKILDAITGLPIANATVTFTHAKPNFAFYITSTIGTATTDANGIYQFGMFGSTLPLDHTYTIKAQKDNDYSTADTSFDISSFLNKTTELPTFKFGHTSMVTIKCFNTVAPILSDDYVDINIKSSNGGSSIGGRLYNNNELTIGTPADTKNYIQKKVNKNGVVTTSIDSVTFLWKKPNIIIIDF